MNNNQQLIDIETFEEFDNHEYVSSFFYRDVGLKGIIAIHNTNRGPATGGTRMWFYPKYESALKDALNLSKAMTYKCALAGLNFGGGKAVIIGNPNKNKNEKLLERYGSIIESWKGYFTTGTDLGIDHEDTIIMARKSKYILGQNAYGLTKFDTSKMAALGVYYGILGTLENMAGDIKYSNTSVAIKGVGKLGEELLRLLYERGVKLYFSDINKNKINYIKNKFPKSIYISHDKIHSLDVDVYSPCAFGGEFTNQSINEIKAKAIVGGANNQLKGNDEAQLLFKRGIIYSPDYIVNAGGLINIVDELESDGYKKDRVLSRIKNIKNTIKKILNESSNENVSPYFIANNRANKLIKNK